MAGCHKAGHMYNLTSKYVSVLIVVFNLFLHLGCDYIALPCHYIVTTLYNVVTTLSQDC